MDIVVFDIETIKAINKGDIQHIVEVGACKLRLDHNPKIKDTFQMYVQPNGVKVDESTRKFIKAPKEAFTDAKNTNEVLNEFSEWIGDDYYLCSWSESDLYILIEQSSRYGFSLNWLKNYNDVQRSISKAFKNDLSPIALRKALLMAGIEIKGKRHSGLDDSINTAQLMIKYKNCFRLQTNNPSENYSIFSPLYKDCNDCGETKFYKEYRFRRGKYLNKCKDCFYAYQRNK
jgi:sporulation inhibitor KapD